MGETTQVDLSTLRDFASGPLTTTINKLREAATKLDGATPNASDYPPVAQDAARAQHNATIQSADTFVEAMRTIAQILERLKIAILNYAQTEETNTQLPTNIEI